MPATPSLKLPRKAILRARADFERIRAAGLRAVQQHVVCNFFHDPARPSRGGFIVTRACGPAHIRNLIRRRLREIYRQNIAPRATAGLQTVWIARQNAALASYARLKEEMLHLAAKAGCPDGPEPPPQS